ncbi:aminopeptidase N [Verticiella sediminum]|uniref:Aminopeptidase N n=1 Tax=Verticiella sediminum TaxID=1247510 RepID=A0A556AZL5_9BURK|nr:aminopeptidase N [Verticiella sediminum]TSH98380.1 aminopeptidase N [Verticiella sediminum]
MRSDTPVTIRRQDYQPYPFAVDTVALAFDLQPALTTVTAELEVVRQHPGDLVLDGEDLELVSVAVDGQPLASHAYQLAPTTLTIPGLGERARLTLVSRCRPAENATLMGLYVSNGVFFTQCEAEGFRRITWFPDRPDVMSRYTVTLRAPKADFPQLLSNGNLIAQRELADGRHEAVWEDPFRKPCYLFALVAGKLAWTEKRVRTRSGRDVLLQVYTDPGNEGKTEWALASLERSLRWDETRFDLELDLDRFMIVAARDFNMGAMENKGLNIFNAAYVLADPDSATDANYSAIEAVIGHEYFHNWTGNRVTCRDWFQLSLKEGLTVFRDQEFTADMMAAALADTGLTGDALAKAQASARTVKRIDDVIALRAAQFPEDAGPMAHPIRPESYQEIGNFYTATVYEKGAEVIRMQHTLLGEAGFQRGMAEYFRRHDGQAVTCDDFVDAMESVYRAQHPERDLTAFRRWYRQAGTPRVRVTLAYDAQARTCTVTLAQHCAPVGVERLAGDSLHKAPVHIPFKIGLLDAQGHPLPLRLSGSDAAASDTVVLELTEASQHWVFTDVPGHPVPSLLRDFSAPVIVEYDYTDRDLALLLAHDTNAYARREAGQELAARHILAHASGATTPPDDAQLVQAWRAVLDDPQVDPGWRARALNLPAEKVLAERMSPIDPGALAQARDLVRARLGRDLAGQWRAAIDDNQTPGAYSPDPLSAGRRDLKNLALSYLLAGGDAPARELAELQYRDAGNMTDRLAALAALVNHAPGAAADAALADFYQRSRRDPLMLDKWFALQATARTTDAGQVRKLLAHSDFTLRNPNRARALVFQFCLNNPRHFHAADGAGYRFWAEQVLALDAFNPEIAARLARGLEQWTRYAPVLRDAMHAALERVRSQAGLSRNVTEIVSKALEISA